MRKHLHLRGFRISILTINIIFSFFFLTKSSLVVAQTGVLDMSFGNGGKVITHVSVGTGEDNIEGLAMQPDGKLVGVGVSWDGSTIAMTIVRYNINGKLDSSFGINGIVRTAINSYADNFSAVAIQPDGKILAAGTTTIPYAAPADEDIVIARYNSNGTLDATFGNGGITTTDFAGGVDNGNFVLLRPDGKIIVGGNVKSVSSEGFGMVQYKSNGTVDSTFGINGKVFTAISGGYAASAVFQADNKILLGGNATNNSRSDEDFAVIRYNTNGSIDNSFGINGIASIDFANGDDYGNSLAVQADGKILLTGGVAEGLKQNIGIVRYKTDGTPDSTFGMAGKVLTNLSSRDEAAYKIDVQPDGKIIVSGGTDLAYPNSSGNFALLRYNTSGTPDSSFGKRGLISTDFLGLRDEAFTSLIQPDGKIVLAGTASLANRSNDFAIARYEKNALIYYNTLKGSIFIDYNLNGIKEVNEPYYSNGNAIVTNPGKDTITENSTTGRFTIDVDSGTYVSTVKPSLPYYNIVPASFTTSHQNYFNTDSISFALQPVPNKKDLAISLIPETPARPGFNTDYRLLYTNQGTESILNYSIQFVKSNKLTLVSSSIVPTAVHGDTLLWSFAAIQPLEVGNIFIKLAVATPPAANNGDTLSSTAIILPITIDLTPDDNTSLLTQRVTGSFDPNNKTESHAGSLRPQQVVAGEYLNYTVRFQNTGTDTAFNVYVKDTLSNKLDWSTFQPIASTHSYHVNLTTGNKLTWTFNNIRLADSNRNETASHGYITYRIKPKTSLLPGDTIRNSASIYFDYNLLVATNTENTVIVDNVLPVQLIAFTAESEGKNNLLKWSTVKEVNVDKYEVERSINGAEFFLIGSVKASGIDNYTYTDNKRTKGISYYRLRLVDRNGKFEYSFIRTVNNSGSFTVAVYPNPVNNNLRLEVDIESRSKLQLQIVDMQGKVLLTKDAIVEAGSTLKNINMASLKSGNYFIRISSSSNEQLVLKFEKL